MNELLNIAEIKITYKPSRAQAGHPRIASSRSAYDLLWEAWKEQDDIYYRESFAVLLMNRANKVVGISWISKGGVAGTVADPKMILQAALKSNSSAIIIAHNHPSGNSLPSPNDHELTRKIKGACEFMDISLLDHLILAGDEYYSFADEGSL